MLIAILYPVVTGTDVMADENNKLDDDVLRIAPAAPHVDIFSRLNQDNSRTNYVTKDYSYLSPYLDNHQVVIFDINISRKLGMTPDDLHGAIMTSPYKKDFEDTFAKLWQEEKNGLAESLLPLNDKELADKNRKRFLEFSGQKSSDFEDRDSLKKALFNFLNDDPRGPELLQLFVADEIYENIETNKVQVMTLGDHSIIVAPDPTKDASRYAQDLAHLPLGYVLNLDAISSDDINTFAMLHEAGHLRPARKAEEKLMIYDHPALEALTEEVEADKFAVRSYFNMASRGYKLSPDMPQAFEDIRAISTLRLSNTFHSNWDSVCDHTTNVGYEPVDGQPSPRMGSHDTSAAILASMTVSSYTNTLLAATDPQTKFLFPHPLSAGESLTVLGTYDPGKIGTQEQRTIEKLMDSGARIAEAEPLRQYAEVKALHEKGFFNANLMEKEIASEYIEAMERRVPAAKTADAQSLIAQYSNSLRDITPASLQSKADFDLRAKSPEKLLHSFLDSPPPAGP